MDRKTFEEKMQMVQAKLQTSERPGYWHGFQHGLMRQYHGETFTSPEEHREWMEKANSVDKETYQEGRGYMDGFLS